jgi:ferredoxin
VAAVGRLPGGVPAIGSFLLTFALLAAVMLAVARPMLLADRFLPGAGWVEAALLAAYSAFLTSRMLDPRQSSNWRRRAWGLFSAVFFGQLALGLLGFERFLMTGALHLPVPAMIVAGPLYRGEGWFMPVLFGATVLLVGPAWCSLLCYMGAWDGFAAFRARRPASMPRWRSAAHVAVLAGVASVAVGLRLLDAPGDVALIAGLAFGIAGVGVMAWWSRRSGVMTQCTAWCPIGVLAPLLGKLSPFRMRITTGCTDCGACTLACRFDALRKEDVVRRRPGFSCTLCGDCVRSCRGRFVEYRFAGLSPDRARALFLVLVVSLHAAFMGIARI